MKSVYCETRAWPRDELYGLTSQARRAAVSIPTNLAEGRGRDSASEMARFARIALGPAYELDTLLIIAGDLGYQIPQTVGNLRTQIASLARRIQSFIRYQQSKCK